MASPIKLKSDEQALLREIHGLVDVIRSSYSFVDCEKTERGCSPAVLSAMDSMAEKAHALHMSLKGRGWEPKHHKYMKDNRGVSTDERAFYHHLHPVEDLIAFINDPDANNDPEDSTLNVRFDFSIYTRRWGRYDHYTVTRTAGGWTFVDPASGSSERCDKNGSPWLEKTLEHDAVCYPAQVGALLAWLWQQAAEGAAQDEVQKALTDLGEWISVCEKNTPRGLFKGYKK